MSELFETLKKYADSDALPMHMPGHKRCMGDFGNPFFIDITEIDGFDNLHQAEGILLEAQKRAAKLYGSEETHYLINGSTAGILAAISGCTTFGGKILLARNSHKSTYHASFLKNLQNVYIYPQILDNLGINGPILPKDVEKVLKEEKNIQAILITSPTYDGVVSDVKSIARVAHAYGVPLIVDEAHGAHFPFSESFPEDSVSCGADVVIHSLHKTLPSLTQTALIHLNGTLIDKERIRRYLTMYQTSSPSYVLMASIDSCVEWISYNKKEFILFEKRLMHFREVLKGMRHLKLLEVPGMDFSKILVSVRHTDLTGYELSDLLRKEYHIEPEMACGTYVCAITTVADSEESLRRFADALLEIDESLLKKTTAAGSERTDTILKAEQVCTIQEAEEYPKKWISLKEALGKTSGDFVTLYPPGIPVLTPGEKVSAEIIERILQYEQDGFEVHGARECRIQVLKRER